MNAQGTYLRKVREDGCEPWSTHEAYECEERNCHAPNRQHYSTVCMKANESDVEVRSFLKSRIPPFCTAREVLRTCI